MTTEASRPPVGVVALFLIVIFGVGGWVMLHTYDDHDPGECGRRYQQARSTADSAAVDRFIPDSERDAVQEHSCGVLRGPTPREFARADSLLRRAITATGGDSALTALRAFEWDGTATQHAAGGPVEVEGSWRLALPDTMVITTWRREDRPGTSRRVVVMGKTAWSEAAGDTVALTTGERAEHRHLCYVYSLLRLVTLREPGVTILPVPLDSAGRAGLLVRTPGELDTALYFGSDGRVEVVRTLAAPTRGMPTSAQEITFTGVTEVAGVRWFREMHVARDGAPVLDLTIADAHP